jgi:hypothetical protein
LHPKQSPGYQEIWAKPNIQTSISSQLIYLEELTSNHLKITESERAEPPWLQHCRSEECIAEGADSSQQAKS